MNIRFALPARRLVLWLGCGVAFLLLMHLVGLFFHLVLQKKAEAFVMLFDLDIESNVPTFYNCLLFFLCAGLFLVHSRSGTPEQRNGWLVMAAAFAFLGLDEGSQIHEKFILMTLRLLNGGSQSGTDMGWFYYAWVIPYGLAAALLGLVVGKWIFRLDPLVRRGLILSGGLYVLGAAFMEMYSGKIAEQLDSSLMTAEQMAYIPCEIYAPGTCHHYVCLPYIIAYTLEETLEMSGLVMCAYVLMSGLGQRRTIIEIATAPSR